MSCVPCARGRKGSPQSEKGQGRQFSVTADFDGEKTSLFKRVSGGKSQNLGRAGGNDPCSRQPTYARTELSAD